MKCKSFLTIYNPVPKKVRNSIPITNSMRLGPVGFVGTAAPLITVNAGVRSCTFAFAA